MNAALIQTFVITLGAFTALWLIHVWRRDAGIVDYYWGPGFAAIAASYVALSDAISSLQWAFFAMVGLWAVRLAAHLIRRHLGSSDEDGRYAHMRKAGGAGYWWQSLFTVFLLQALLQWVIAAPVHAAMLADAGRPVPGLPFVAGVVIFAAGLALEWIADTQLWIGKKSVSAQRPGSGTVSVGLWRRSRHPNYLGEMILWWGLSLSAYALSGSLLVFAGPAILTAVILAVSIPLTEAHLLRNRPDYEDYMRRVPRLLPSISGRGHEKQPAE